MALSVKTLFGDKQLENSWPENTRSKRIFQRCVNRSIDDLNGVEFPGYSSDISHVSDIEGTIDELDEKHELIMSRLVDFHTLRGGLKPSDPKLAEAAYKDSEKQREQALDDWWTLKLNSLQSDTTENVIALGYLGDTSSDT